MDVFQSPRCWMALFGCLCGRCSGAMPGMRGLRCGMSHTNLILPFVFCGLHTVVLVALLLKAFVSKSFLLFQPAQCFLDLVLFCRAGDSTHCRAVRTTAATQMRTRSRCCRKPCCLALRVFLLPQSVRHGLALLACKPSQVRCSSQFPVA